MKKHYKYISSTILLLAVNYISAQNIIAIEVDSIYCQDSTCHLLNFSEDHVYSCNFLSLEQTEHRYKQTIDCSFDRELNGAKEKSNLLSLKKITTLEQFKSWVYNMQFSADFSYNGMKFNEQYKSLNDKYGIIESKKIEGHTRRKVQLEIYQITPIKVNDEYYIAGLIEIDDYEITHLIFPDKLSKGMMHYLNRIYLPSTSKIEIDYSEIHKNIFNTYKIRNIKSKKVLTNSYSSMPILEGVYDDIILDYPFVVTKQDGKVKIYDETLKNITPDDLIEAYSNFGSLQIITKNEVKWLNSSKIVTDTMPKIERILGCGNVGCYEKTIVYINGEFIEITKDCDYSVLGGKAQSDSIVFNLNRDLQSIKYLNNETTRVFSVDCFMQFYCNPGNLYYFKTHDNRHGLFKRVNEKEEIIDEILANRSLSSQEQWKLVKPIRDSLQISFRYDILFEGKFENMKLLDYNHPIIFKNNGRFGVFPLMKKAKYKSIKPYIGNLAEVTFENNETGWLDLKGQEIRKKRN